MLDATPSSTGAREWRQSGTRRSRSAAACRLGRALLSSVAPVQRTALRTALRARAYVEPCCLRGGPAYNPPPVLAALCTRHGSQQRLPVRRVFTCARHRPSLSPLQGGGHVSGGHAYGGSRRSAAEAAAGSAGRWISARQRRAASGGSLATPGDGAAHGCHLPGAAAACFACVGRERRRLGRASRLVGRRGHGAVAVALIRALSCSTDRCRSRASDSERSAHYVAGAPLQCARRAAAKRAHCGRRFRASAAGARARTLGGRLRRRDAYATRFDVARVPQHEIHPEPALRRCGFSYKRSAGACS
jgi:hypothetical protein